MGRIRTTPDSMIDDDEDGSILSLGLFPGEMLEIPGDERTMFRFEAAWDSSLHNSLLLRPVTLLAVPSGQGCADELPAAVALEEARLSTELPIPLKVGPGEFSPRRASRKLVQICTPLGTCRPPAPRPPRNRRPPCR